jgi:hypothetical protein
MGFVKSLRRVAAAGWYSRNVISLPPVLDLFGIPPVRIEEVGIIPDLGVHVDVVERDDDDCALFHFVPTR